MSAQKRPLDAIDSMRVEASAARHAIELGHCTLGDFASSEASQRHKLTLTSPSIALLYRFLSKLSNESVQIELKNSTIISGTISSESIAYFAA